MDMSAIQGYLSQYGMLALFIIVFLEYLNLPGFPAGIIMPLAGIWAHQLGQSFLWVLLVSVVAGLLGSWMLYLLGFCIGGTLIDWFRRKFKKQGAALDKAINFVKEKGYIGLLLAKLLPAIRTIIGSSTLYRTNS